MGLINNDVFEASNGVQKSGTYVSFTNETLYLRKGNSFMPPSGSGSGSQKKYSVNANYRIYWDKAARDADKSFMEIRSVTASVSESELTSNLYEILYAQLKVQYPNSEDDMVRSSAPSSDPAPAPSSDPAPAPSSEPALSSDPAPALSSDPAPAPSSEPAPSSDPAPSSEPAPSS